MATLDDNERELFEKLILASSKLATAADNASMVLSEEHQSMTQPFVEEVRNILARCPNVGPTQWKGELDESDLKIDIFRTGHEGVNVDNLGVKIIHLPTGIGRESQSKPSQLQNREVAMKALRDAVDKHYRGK